MLRRKPVQLLFFTGICVVVIYFTTRKTHGQHSHDRHSYGESSLVAEREETSTNLKTIHENTNENTKVSVDVNNQKTFQGLKIKNELYVPFTFLSDYYGFFGKFVQSKEFKWYHVDPLLVNPSKQFPKYTTQAEYLTFQTANVPKRARVKCICGRHEVPITTQWDPKGYYYPTQVAQYGLSFLSKYHLEPTNKIQKKLSIPKDSGSSAEIYDVPDGLFVLKIKFKNEHSAFKVKVLASNGETYSLSYVLDNTMIHRSKDGIITHGIGEPNLERVIITRDLNVDLMKGLSFQEGKRNGVTVSFTVKKIEVITLIDPEGISHARLLEKDYESNFMAAADWFVNFQDEKGGWKVDVKRAIRKGMEAKPGWYSAMGQGQAISLLTRVYLHTNDNKYLDAALKAIKVFHKTSMNHGVQADLFGSPWYEEYPTQPPSFVLNGFIYSLFGLYDLWKISGDIRGSEAKSLFLNGFKTLEKMIPLFDNGHGTFYDLRHITMPGISPNRARWQYHQVHLEQLTALISIKKSKILQEVLKRWLGYVSGILSRHN